MGIAKEIKARTVVMQHNIGATIAELAKMHGLSKATIRNYIREDEARKKDKKAAEQKEAAQKKKKAERDKERRNTIAVRSALAEERKERVRADIKTGLSMQEIAKKENLSYCTVTDIVRGDALPEDAETYRDVLCTAVRKSELRQWAKDQPGRTIRTPDGKMTALRAYPHIMECARRCPKGFVVVTYTLGQLYYMNRGGQDV